MIKLSIKTNSEQVKAAIEGKRAAVRAGLSAEMDRLMLELLRKVQAKLSGEVLQQRSSQLLNSARKEPTRVEAGKLVGKVQVGGGLASVYPAVQEYGGVKDPYDIYPVNKKALAFFPSTSLGATSLRIQGRALRFKLGKRRGSLRPTKYGEFAELGGVVVKHVSHPKLPERSYMRSSMREMRDTIIERLRARLQKELA